MDFPQIIVGWRNSDRKLPIDRRKKNKIKKIKKQKTLMSYRFGLFELYILLTSADFVFKTKVCWKPYLQNGGYFRVGFVE